MKAQWVNDGDILILMETAEDKILLRQLVKKGNVSYLGSSYHISGYGESYYSSILIGTLPSKKHKESSVE